MSISAVEESYQQGVPLDVDRFVHHQRAHKHDLFLIPSGTVHCAGKDTLVLEISATPYIFTFKIYDWLRLDLEGKPRPLNIGRAFENLRFECKGERIETELIAHPVLVEVGEGWRLIHLPTHAEHFYDVYRVEFQKEVEAQVQGTCHVMSLVEGTSILLETAQGLRQRFNFAETFVIPAAAGAYRLINEGDKPAVVVRAVIKLLESFPQSSYMG